MYTNKEIWNVSYPIFLGLLAQNIINVTDTAFLGRVGEVELGCMRSRTVTIAFCHRIANVKQFTDILGKHISNHPCDNDNCNRNGYNSAQFFGQSHTDRRCDGLWKQCDILFV